VRIDGLEAAVVVALVDGVPDGSLIVERFPVGVRWTITTIDEHKAARDVAVADARAYLAQLARELTDAHQPPADALDA
jgi:hypothetical protein